MAAGAPCGAERDESAEEEEKKHSAEDDVRDEEEARNAAKPGRRGRAHRPLPPLKPSFRGAFKVVRAPPSHCCGGT